MCRLTSVCLILIAFASCRTVQDKGSGPGAGLYQTGGTFKDGAVVVPVPKELHLVTPKTNSSNSQVFQSGLELTSDRPETTGNIEGMIVKCFNQDNNFVADNWFFYSELLTGDGKVKKKFDEREISRCSDMQIALTTLVATQTYVVQAAFYWKSQDGKQTVVWYEGKTKRFKPSDQDINLVLTKLIQDQVVNVEFQKTDKELCELNQSIWIGGRCLDHGVAMSFVYTDKTDTADSKADTEAMCLSNIDDSKSGLRKCIFNDNQLFVPVTQEIQRLKDTNYLWFKLVFGDDETKCLTAQRHDGIANPVLARADCRTVKDGNEEIPDAAQLFTFKITDPADGRGRNTVQIINSSDGGPKCISIPSGSLLEEASAQLVDCTKDKEFQFIRFADPT